MLPKLQSVLLPVGLGLVLACGAEEPEPEPVLHRVEETRAPGTVGAIEVSVTDLRSDDGVVLLRLYRGGAGFPGEADAAFRVATLAIAGGTAAGAFEDLPHDEYALWVCHDEDDDGELDTNFIGMPKEGVAVSGPPPKFMPTYEGARFVLDSERTEQSIGMVYL